MNATREVTVGSNPPDDATAATSHGRSRRCARKVC